MMLSEGFLKFSARRMDLHVLEEDFKVVKDIVGHRHNLVKIPIDGDGTTVPDVTMSRCGIKFTEKGSSRARWKIGFRVLLLLCLLPAFVYTGWQMTSLHPWTSITAPVIVYTLLATNVRHNVFNTIIMSVLNVMTCLVVLGSTYYPYMSALAPPPSPSDVVSPFNLVMLILWWSNCYFMIDAIVGGDSFLPHHAVTVALISMVLNTSLKWEGETPEETALKQEQLFIGGLILYVLELPGPLHHLNRFVRNQKMHELGMLVFVYSRFLFSCHYFLRHVIRLWSRYMAVGGAVRTGFFILLALCTAILLVNMTWIYKIFAIYIDNFYASKLKKEEQNLIYNPDGRRRSSDAKHSSPLAKRE